MSRWRRSILRTAVPMVCGLCWACVCLPTGVAEDLLIIVPYGPDPDPADPRQTAWDDYGKLLADYKETTGLSAASLTLDAIDRGYAGRDLAEKIKRGIHYWATMRGTDYVMLVGDASLFPVRYQLKGYTTTGDILYFDSGDPAPRYENYACDAYYANLWDDDDPGRAFDDWDADGDGIFGECYRDNIRGIDQFTIHPDVAVARVPCGTPEEFHQFILKVIRYENMTSRFDRMRTGLFASGTYPGSEGLKRDMASDLGATWEIGRLVMEDDGTYHTVVDGVTSACPDPAAYISDYVRREGPCFVNYAGHGSRNSWSEVGWGVADASVLSNAFSAATLFAAACGAGEFVLPVAFPTLPTMGVTSSADVDGMPEALLAQAPGGGVAYVGCITASQDGAQDLDRYFFRAVGDGAATVGDVWRETVEAFIDRYNLDTFTATDYRAVTDSGDPNYPGRWDWYTQDRFYHIHKFLLFGDPSLRLAGVSHPDVTPPTTTVSMEPWINAQDLADAVGGVHVHPVELLPFDAGTGVLETHYWYRRDDTWTRPAMGTTFDVTVPVERGLDGTRRELLRCYSVDRVGNAESTQTADVGYDFTPPVTDVLVDGDPIPTRVDGAVSVAGATVHIEAEDLVSGVWGVEHKYSEHGAWTFGFGNRVELDVDHRHPCFSMSSELRLYYRARDFAGNISETKQVLLNLGTMRSATYLLCFGEIIERIYPFPPRLLDELVELAFDEKLAGMQPEGVSFDFSGPVTADYQGHKWTPLGKADYNPNTAQWVMPWKTREAGILNAYYWVRAEPEGPGLRAVDPSEPFLLLIDNAKRDEEYTLETALQEKLMAPGENLDLQVRFRNLALGDLHDVTMGLVSGTEQFEIKDPDSLRARRAEVKAGAEWVQEFQLRVASDAPYDKEIRIGAFIHADEVACLLSEESAYAIDYGLGSVSGAVLNATGHGVRAKVMLAGGAYSTSKTVVGDFGFDGVPPGTYTVTATLEEGYRHLVPSNGQHTVHCRGTDERCDFIVAWPDDCPPVVTHELRWHEAAAHSILYGTVYDCPYGEGVEGMRIRVHDHDTGLWLDAAGNWSGLPHVFAPDVLAAVDAFAADIETHLGHLPPDRIEEERAKLGRMSGWAGYFMTPMAWRLQLPGGTPLAEGWRVCLVEAFDRAGNTGTIEVAPERITADFAVALPSTRDAVKVGFEDRSRGLIIERRWDFGDGSSSLDRDPSHKYEGPGIYPVTLTLTGPYTSSAETRILYLARAPLEIVEVAIAPLQNSRYYAVRYPRDEDLAGTGIVVERADSAVLPDWTTKGIVQEWEVGPAVDGIEQVTALVPADGATRVVRLKATGKAP